MALTPTSNSAILGLEQPGTRENGAASLLQFSSIMPWATQVLVDDLQSAIDARAGEGFSRLPGPVTTRGALLEKGVERVFLFPRQLLPGEPDICQLFCSLQPVSELALFLESAGFDCGPVNNTCPWGAFISVLSSVGLLSYVYNLKDEFRPRENSEGSL